ncbi:Retrovirus-related Pol polyprotein LINE-1 [Cricetulus griseus]|uniref:Retrovirus-related Pol polyprotein LINE-1 n=1 Tax=Cricetulus griseus TaxID=10029 RepID=G3HAV6_CRIGR|nr:Retrovirus-related Pol polyprotein LINE-1 [Cricetulus griseus]
MGPPETENFRKAKDTVSKTKQLPTDWEKIFINLTSDKRLLSKIYKEHKKVVTKTSNNPIKKWGTELNREFSMKETKMVERHIRKCLAIRKCKSKQLRDTILLLSEWLKSKTSMIAYAGEDVEKGEHSSTAGGRANLCSHFGY